MKIPDQPFNKLSLDISYIMGKSKQKLRQPQITQMQVRLVAQNQLILIHTRTANQQQPINGSQSTVANQRQPTSK